MENERHTALLVMDVQGATVKALEEKEKEKLFTSLRKAIAAARENKIAVIYVVVGFRKGYPEVSANNKMFGSILSGSRSFDKEEDYKVAEEVAPQNGDIVITKKRVSAFAGSDLEVILRAKEIKEIVLAGIATSGVVLSTVREAADKDYQITVLSDCCADRDEEVHRVLTTKVFPRQAEVMASEEWAKQLAK
jgi:nicotinamidase-related amidase